MKHVLEGYHYFNTLDCVAPSNKSRVFFYPLKCTIYKWLLHILLYSQLYIHKKQTSQWTFYRLHKEKKENATKITKNYRLIDFAFKITDFDIHRCFLTSVVVQ